MAFTLRRDYYSERFVFTREAAEARAREGCSICTGDPSFGRSLLALKEREGALVKEEESDEWEVKVVEPAEPLASPEGDGQQPSLGLLVASRPRGLHRVAVLARQHGMGLSQLGRRAWLLGLTALQDQLRSLYAQRGIAYVALFADDPEVIYQPPDREEPLHALAHLLGLSFVPKAIREEVEAQNTYYEDKGECALCAVLKQEGRGPRHLFATGAFVALAPWASARPYAIKLVPKAHSNSYSRLTQRELDDLALALEVIFRALQEVLPKQPYHLVFNDYPSKRSTMDMHFSIEIYSDPQRRSALEEGWGLAFNRVRPEAAARALAPACRRLLAERLGAD
ncbi:MAG: hypothetical protein C4339_04135 [Nitrososphaerota archaeon]